MCSEFEEARARLAAAEREEAEARRAAGAAFRADLDTQVEEKRHRHDAEKSSARATQLLLQERAKLAEREQREARKAAVVKRAEYRTVLQHQVL